MYTRDPKYSSPDIDLRSSRQDAVLGDDVVFYLRFAIGPETASAPPLRRSLTEVFKLLVRLVCQRGQLRSGPGGDLDLMGQWLRWIDYSQI